MTFLPQLNLLHFFSSQTVQALVSAVLRVYVTGEDILKTVAGTGLRLAELSPQNFGDLLETT